jgi:hypothetical protein
MLKMRLPIVVPATTKKAEIPRASWVGAGEMSSTARCLP